MRRGTCTGLTLLLGGVGTLGCGGGNGNDPSLDGDVSFMADVQPIFNSKCVACHHEGHVIMDVDLENPFDDDDGIIRRENTWLSEGSDEEYLVDPGNPDNSFLITKVADPNLDIHIDGKMMPYQPPRLSEEELAAVRQWIEDGAEDSEFFAENVAPIFGTEASHRPSLAGKCTYCHYPGAPSGMSVTDPFDPEEGMVGVDSRYDGKIVAPGDPEASMLMQKLTGDGPGAQMPLHASRLTESEVDALRTWIAAGAPNN